MRAQTVDSSSTFWWTRFEVTKEPREWTPLRIKAAERAVKREADRMALFPELRRFTTVEQRCDQMEKRSLGIAARLRAARAKNWREARQFLRRLSSEDRSRVLAKWNTRFTPGNPTYLFAVAKGLGIPTPNPFEPKP